MPRPPCSDEAGGLYNAHDHTSEIKRCQERVRNRLVTSVGDLGIVEVWGDQNNQFRVVGFIMC